MKRRIEKLEEQPEHEGPLAVWYEDTEDDALFHNRETGKTLNRAQLDKEPGRRIVVHWEKTPTPEWPEKNATGST